MKSRKQTDVRYLNTDYRQQHLLISSLYIVKFGSKILKDTLFLYSDLSNHRVYQAKQFAFHTEFGFHLN